MSRHDDEEEGFTPDELIAMLTGRCPHEVQRDRVMGLLGLAAAEAGGKLVLSLEKLKKMNGLAVAIHFDEEAGTATVEVLEAPTKAADVPKPTHTSTETRH